MNKSIFKDIHPFKSENNKWGYKKSDIILISPVYEAAMPYYDNLCWVKQNAWGAVDIAGHKIISFIYKSVTRVSCNRYLVCTFKDRYGLIDNTGNIIIDVKYNSILKVSTEILRLERNRELEWCDLDGNHPFDNVNDNITDIEIYGLFTELILEDHKYVFHKDGNSFFICNEYDCWTYNDNYIVFAGNYDESYEKYELFVYSSKGQLVYNRFVTDSLNDVLIVDKHIVLCQSTQEKEHYIIFVDINSQTESIIPNGKSASILDQNYISFISTEEDKGFGILNSNGDIVIPCDYSGLGEGFFNKIVYGSYFDGKNIAATKDGEKCGIIDISQRIVVPFKYTKIKDSGLLNHKACLVLSNGLWGVIDLNNQFIIECKYQEINTFCNNQTVAKLNDLYGVINEDGDTIIPFIYDNLRCLSNGYYIAKSKGYYYVLDPYGNITIDNVYNSIEYAYSKNVVRVTKWNHWGYTDMYGDEIVPCLFVTRDGEAYLDNGMDVPCYVHNLSYQVNIEKLKNENDYLLLEKLENENDYLLLEDISLEDLEMEMEESLEGSEYSDDEHDDIVEYQGYYIYRKAKHTEYLGESRRSMSCLVNPEGKVLYTSLHSPLYFRSSDDQTIMVVATNYCGQEAFNLTIDRSTMSLRVSYTQVDGSDLLVATIGSKHGVASSQKELLLPIEYNKISIIGDFAYAESSLKCIFWHAIKGIIKLVLFNDRKDLYFQAYQIESLSDHFIRFYKDYHSETGIDMILNSSGDIVFSQIKGLSMHGNLYIIWIPDNINNEMLSCEETESSPCDYVPKLKCQLYDTNLTPLYPNEYYQRITCCKCGMFIGNNNNEYVVFDTNGQKLFATSSYTSIHEFQEGLAIVEQHGKYGVIDISGREIVPCVHSKISDFKGGIAQTEKYGSVVEIYKDGRMQKVLWGKVRDDTYCHITNNRLTFVRNNMEEVSDYLQSYKNDMLLITYENGEYTIYDEFISASSNGKLFFVNKTGLIISYKLGNNFMRLSSSSILIGSDELTKQYISEESLSQVQKDWYDKNQDTYIITIDGEEIKYISSLDNNTHFIIKGDRYAIVNNCMEPIWSTSKRMNILSKGNGFYKIYTFSNYVENVHNDEDDFIRHTKTKIQVWDSCTKTEKTSIAACSYFYDFYNIHDVKFSTNGQFMIIPIIRDTQAIFTCRKLYLLVLNDSDEITIDKDFGQAKIDRILDDKILLSNYYTDFDYIDETDYYESTIRDGYTLLSLNGGVLGKGHDEQYFTIEKHIREHSSYEDPSNYIRRGIYDLENDMEIVPVEYKYCKILKFGEEIYTIVKGENEKLGLFYGASQVLECTFKDIDRLTSHAEKKRDSDSPELEMETDYIRFIDFDNQEGLIYNGKIVCEQDAYIIKGIDTIYSDNLEEVFDFAIVNFADTMNIYHGNKLIGTYKACKVRLSKREKDGCFLKLIDGDREGLVGENGCFIPLADHKILFDEYRSSDCHICIIGDRVYEKDGKTTYIGDNVETLVAIYSNYATYYAFWDSDNYSYRFYNKNKTVLEYKEENHPTHGTIACINNLSEVVFSYEKEKFIKSPYYEQPEEESEDYCDDYDDSPSIYDNPYYDDNLDMDQQSLDFWNSL